MMKFAMLFPGQGVQKKGMLTDLATAYNKVEQTFTEASNVLGYDLWKLVQKGPTEKLNQTRKTQVAILTASVSIFRIWKDKSENMPTILAGHSLGEYSALVCSEALSFTEAIKLVDLRGKFMQEAVPENAGAMQVIIGLDTEIIARACRESAHNQTVSLVNYNSPNQVVIAGHKAAVERAGVACKLAGAKIILTLPVSVPSHCSLMKSAAEKLAIILEQIHFHTPIYRVINNVDVTIHTSPDKIKTALIRQLYNPVRWMENIEFIAKQGLTLLLEIGPGKTLSGLTKRIMPTLKSISINDPDSLIVALQKSRGK
ncbi:Malonyl CoA-acyl carrier protein transacylase [Candidatus Erwinia haradaeae]|uniref:Malonyl CoA-acyl carrier protein transacylase n=1 Tax=Candidatus Erwinia haradaeae TaxID=1922217 RepID=A0A451D4H4_9GAMM|nr:Malonyl CoA-acyl carrier protein transacylase [Candidatus Erwinia haradaeae]